MIMWTGQVESVSCDFTKLPKNAGISPLDGIFRLLFLCKLSIHMLKYFLIAQPNRFASFQTWIECVDSIS